MRLSAMSMNVLCYVASCDSAESQYWRGFQRFVFLYCVYTVSLYALCHKAFRCLHAPRLHAFVLKKSSRRVALRVGFSAQFRRISAGFSC